MASSYRTSLAVLLFLMSTTSTCITLIAQCHETGKPRPMNNTISAIYVFGDSTVDPGNNDYIDTLFKANWYPYGKDFIHQIPTGRFTNGKLATDFIASYVGVKEYIPAYLDPTIKLEDMITGVAFASAASGYDPLTAAISNVIHMPKQLDHFKAMKAKLEQANGKERTQEHISKAVFIVSAGTNDFVINYYGLPLRRSQFSVLDYQNLLLQQANELYQGLWDEGARRIAVIGLPPMGCVPAVITLMGPKANFRHDKCEEEYNNVAQAYNKKLQSELNNLQEKWAYSGTRIFYVDIYYSLNNIIRSYTKYASFLCNPHSPLCADASKYVFYDSIHPTERTYYEMFRSLIPIINNVIKN
ncbi:GDSL lipase/esterase [Dillenia turbinata]|uniref:GDSL lipase/esterase n=1 Tax=Dillenia turbinata TaxID=194707 RepID=A0AAN8UVQ4_9MAGN